MTEPGDRSRQFIVKHESLAGDDKTTINEDGIGVVILHGLVWRFSITGVTFVPRVMVTVRVMVVIVTVVFMSIVLMGVRNRCGVKVCTIPMPGRVKTAVGMA